VITCIASINYSIGTIILLLLPTFMYTGGMLGPVLFGLAIDHSCLLWEKKCDGSTGACLCYDNHQMAWLFFAVCAACMVLNILCGLLSWQLYLTRLRKGDVPQTKPADITAEGGARGISNSALEEETNE